MEDTSMRQWRKSSYSNGGSAACVEAASTDGVLIRDSTNRDGGTLTFSAEAWERFTASLR
jgi:Domain of unknown function (DUF397)